jgi:hypothetical protein
VTHHPRATVSVVRTSLRWNVTQNRNPRGGIAQLGERLHGMQEVSGSIPLTSTKLSLGFLNLYSCVFAAIFQSLQRIYVLTLSLEATHCTLLTQAGPEPG